MVSTYSSDLRLTKQGDNDNPNTWGEVLNSQVIELIEEAISGVVEIDVTGSSDIDISSTTVNGGSDDARHAVLELTGVIGADIDLIVPSVNKIYFIRGSHTGGVVTVKPSGAAEGVEIDYNEKKIVYVTGSDIYNMVELGLQVTTDDTTPGTLYDKIEVGPSLTKSIENPSADEDLKINLKQNMLLGAIGAACGQPYKPNSSALTTDVIFLIRGYSSLNGKYMEVSSELTKGIDSTWTVGSGNGGLDTGTVSASSTYYIWVINNPTTGITDGLFSLSSSAPVLPSGYEEKRRVGYIKTNSSSEISEWFVFWGEFGPPSSPTVYQVMEVNSSNTPQNLIFTFGTDPTSGTKVVLTNSGGVEADGDLTAYT